MLLGAASAIAGSRILRGQERPPAAGPTFSADVKVVNVLATVRDKRGAIVKDLVKEDFAITEGGHAQTIRHFSRESDLPLSVGLIVDVTPSESEMLETERNASLAFLNDMLRPDKDQAFVIQFSEEVELLQDLTSSREKLKAALGLLGDNPGRRSVSQPRNGGMGRAGGRGAPPGGANPSPTILADAIYLAADEVLKPRTGRKALIVMGDGDHIGSRAQEAIRAAQEADVIVYAIRIYDKNLDGGGNSPLDTLARIALGVPITGPGGGGRGGSGGPGGAPGGGPPQGGSRNGKELKEIAVKTGGASLEVSKKQTIGEIYEQIEEELRNQYSLGYTPDGSADGYRPIKVQVKKKGLAVQARDGYYPDSR